MGTRARWRVAADFELLWRSWDDEFIVHHTGSGDTHHLNPAAAEVLQTLQTTSATTEELTARVASSLEVRLDKALMLYIEEVLTKLKRSGVIERVHQ